MSIMMPAADQTVLDRLDLEVRRVGSTLRNFPPATVYCITRIHSAARWDWRYT